MYTKSLITFTARFPKTDDHTISKMKIKIQPWFFPLALILLHCLYFGYQVANRNYYLEDSYEYLAAARNIHSEGILYAGETPGNNPSLYTKRTPVYPAFLALFPNHKSVLLFIQMLISFFSILLLRTVALRFGYKRAYDPYLFILLFFSPAQFIYSQMIMAEILLQFFLLLFLYAFLNYLYYKKNLHLIFANIFLVFAFMTKPVMYLFFIPELLILLYLSFREKKYNILLPVVIPVVVIFLYMYRNYKKTDYINFSSIQTINLTSYNTYLFLLEKKGDHYASEKIDSIRLAAEEMPDYPEKMNALNKGAFNIIRNNPFAYGIFHIKGMFRFFLDPGRFDLSNFFGLEKKNHKGFLYYQNRYSTVKAVYMVIKEQTLIITAGMFFIFLFNIIKLVLLMVFAFTKQIPLLVRITVLTLILYLAFLTGPLGASRFMMPVLPIIIIFGLTGLFGHEKIKKWMI